MGASHGTFVWYELVTPDPGAAAAFYRDVIGWRGADAGMADPYTILHAADVPVGGIVALPEHLAAAGLRPHWAGYIAVDDVDDYAGRVTAAGGVIHHGPADIPGVGRFAVALDPQGAKFVLFTATGGMPPPLAPDTPGHAGWRELQALDWSAVFEFYAGLFGWTRAEAIDMGSMGTYQLFAQDRVAIGGMMSRHDAAKPSWLYYFNVDGADAAAGRVRPGGGEVLNGPHQVPGGNWIIHCRDPQGAMFALVSPAR